MFANLFSTFQAWVSTTQGSAVVAFIVTAGLILTLLFVVVAHNLYCELSQTRGTTNKRIAELNSDLDSTQNIVTEKTLSLANLSSEFEKSRADSHEALRNVSTERDNFKSQLSTELDDHKLTLARERDLREEVIAQDTTNASLLEQIAHTSVGFRLINSLLSSVVSTKAVVLETVGFNFEQSPSSDKPILNHAFLNKEIAPLLGFNDKHEFGVIKQTTNPENGSLDITASTHIEDVRGVLSTLSSALIDVDVQVSPAYFAQVLYIRSLDLKIILTDFVANPLHLSDENRDAVQLFHSFICSPSVIRSSTHTLVLDKSVWEAMELDGEDALITQGVNKSLYDPVSRLKNLVLV